MPVLATIVNGTLADAPDVNQLITAFLNEHESSDGNEHSDFINLGSDNTIDSERGIIANVFKGDDSGFPVRIFWDPTLKAGDGAFAVDEGDGTTRTILLSTDFDPDATFVTKVDETATYPNSVFLGGLTDDLNIVGDLTIAREIRIGTLDSTPSPTVQDVVRFHGAKVQMNSILVGMEERLSTNELLLKDAFVNPIGLSLVDLLGGTPLVAPGGIHRQTSGGTPTLSSGHDDTDHHNYHEIDNAVDGTDQTSEILYTLKLPLHAPAQPNILLSVYHQVSSIANNSEVDVTVLDTAGVAATLFGGGPFASTSWTEELITVDTSSGTWTAGEYITVRIDLTASPTEQARLGEILSEIF